MLLSMTGYGEGHYQSDRLTVAIELRALNNRYLKVSLRAAEPHNLLEPEFEKVIRRTVRRGTIQAQNIALVGATPDTKTPEGLWPSDHAGVAAQLIMK